VYAGILGFLIYKQRIVTFEELKQEEEDKLKNEQKYEKYLKNLKINKHNHNQSIHTKDFDLTHKKYLPIIML
jgi:hypothetical protein